MIAYIEGKIDRLSPTNALLDVGGVGYDINITLTDYTALQGKPSARLWITEIIREDAHLLYGFVREESRAFFEKLCSVSGVGPSTARLILSSYTPNDLASIIGNGAVDLLKNVKGIGLKTAQRIVVDLKGKIDLTAYDLAEGMPEGGEPSQVAAERRGTTSPQDVGIPRSGYPQSGEGRARCGCSSPCGGGDQAGSKASLITLFASRFPICRSNRDVGFWLF